MSLRLLALIPLAVGINTAMGVLASSLPIPVFLDTVGTVLAAALAGPWVALATGLVSQLAKGLFVSGIQLAFLPIQLFVAAFAAVAASRFAVFATVPRTVAGGLLLGVLAATLSWPISLLAFGGVTSPGVSAVTAIMSGVGLPLEWAVYIASLSSDLIDKTITFLLVRTVLVSLPVRVTARFPAAQAALGRTG